MAYKDKNKEREYKKKYYHKHKEERRESRRKYREEHKEQIKKQKQEDYQKHKDNPEFKLKRKEYGEKYREENKEKIKKRAREYCQRPEVKKRKKIYNERYNKEYYQRLEVKEHGKKWREENKEKRKKYSEEYYEEHKDEIKKNRKEYGKKYEEKHKKFCIDCGKKILRNSLRCGSCNVKGERNPWYSVKGKNHPNFGTIASFETLKKLSAIHQGIPLEQWTKFIGREPYGQNWDNKFKRAIRKRDNQICMNCKIHREKLSRALDIHHVNYNKKLTMPQNCISLCRKCHMLTNKDRTIWTKHFQDLLSNRYGYQYSETREIILNLKEFENKT